MSFEFMRRRPTRRQDELAGTRPAVIFAVGLGVITGAIVVGLFAGGSAVIAHFGGVGSGAHGLLVGAATWLAFWIGLTAGLAGGLTLGFRLWARVAAPRQERRDGARARAEQRAAVREAEELLHGAPPPRGGRPSA